MRDLLVAISTVADGNMLIHEDKSNARVVTNRANFLGSVGLTMDQTTRVDVVYGGENYCRYNIVSLNNGGQGMHDGNVIASDALITTDKNHALFLPLADCVGAVIYDPIQKVLMLSHLGRHNLLQNSGQKSVEFLQNKFHSVPSNLHVWLSPAASKAAYPIWDMDGKGMKEATSEQLLSAGILEDNIKDSPIDTSTDKNYYSHSEFLKGHRKEDGRYAIVAVMR